MKNPIQLTFGKYGHTLHHNQVISPDNEWIVYDTRNEDTLIGITTRIERVNIYSKEVEILYEVKSYNEYGPGVGAATYSPKENQVIFIHGIRNSDENKPYGMSRRTGVSVKTDAPNSPIYMDARNIYSPFTKGALRGGTHSHAWNFDGTKISFTYNDYVLEKNQIHDERVVGVMFPGYVSVPEDINDENNSGKMFSVIVTDIVEHAKHGSDEIEKAFDECWLGCKDSIVFQGWVRDQNGKRKTEIFKIDLPENLSTDRKGFPLEGTEMLRPQVPKNIIQKRVSDTLKGVSSFRHWLRSDPTGNIVYFLMEDDKFCTNIFSLDLSNNKISQVTYHNESINSPFNISSDGTKLVYFSAYKLYIYDLSINQSILLLEEDLEHYGIPNFDKNGKFIFYNKYVLEENTSKFLQIFKIEL
jgi:hypothetical protein